MQGEMNILMVDTIKVLAPKTSPAFRTLGVGNTEMISDLRQLLFSQKPACRYIYLTDRNRHAIPLFDKANITQTQIRYHESVSNLQ